MHSTECLVGCKRQQIAGRDSRLLGCLLGSAPHQTPSGTIREAVYLQGGIHGTGDDKERARGNARIHRPSVADSCASEPVRKSGGIETAPTEKHTEGMG